MPDSNREVLLAFRRATFMLGLTLITPEAARAAGDRRVHEFLQRHARGDWGDVCADDAAANDEALLSGGRLLSKYTDANGLAYYCITEADRSATTLLLREQY